MCGLVGVFGESMMNKDFDFLVQALHVDVLRGDDGTGLALLGRDGNVCIKKSAQDAYTFCVYESVDFQLKTFLKGNGAIGHNRASTSGADVDANCHPFHHGNIVLAHNGTLRSREGLVDSEDYEVDSENICHTFAKHYEKDIIPEIDGAFALTWYDTGLKEMNLIRNKERPLYLAKKKGANTYYWASEEGMLSWLLKRNHIEFEAIEMLAVGERNRFHFVQRGGLRILEREITKLEVIDYNPKAGNTYYQNWWQGAANKTEVVKVDTSKSNPHGLKSGDYVMVEVTGSNVKPYTGRKNNGQGFVDTYTLYGMPCEVHGVDLNIPQGRYTVKVSCVDELKYSGETYDMVYAYKPLLVEGDSRGLTVEEITKDVVDDIAREEATEEMVFDTYDMQYISVKDFNHRTKDGCCYCSADIFQTDATEVQWLDAYSPICESCQKAEPWIEDKSVMDSYNINEGTEY